MTLTALKFPNGSTGYDACKTKELMSDVRSSRREHEEWTVSAVVDRILDEIRRADACKSSSLRSLLRLEENERRMEKS